MSLSVRALTSYALHLGKAKGRYGIHSPFVYELLVNCIRDQRYRPAFGRIEERVEELKKDRTPIEVRDLGAGSKWSKGNERKVKDIASRSGPDKSFARLLFRLAERFAPHNAIELGASLGIGTLYLSAGSSGTVHSIEGCPVSARIAERSLKRCSMTNGRIHQASFAEKLPELLEQLPSLDLMRIDGDHRGEALLAHWEQGMQKAHNDTLFIMDDIHWSEDMEEAWEELKKDPRVTLTLDLYHAGLLFIRREQKEPLHFRIRA